MLYITPKIPEFWRAPLFDPSPPGLLSHKGERRCRTDQKSPSPPYGRGETAHTTIKNLSKTQVKIDVNICNL